MAGGAAIAETGSKSRICHDVSRAVGIYAGAEALSFGEFTLKELAAASNGSRGVALNQVD